MDKSFVSLSGNARFCLTGSDRLRYLNGQVTNDVAKAMPDTAIPACVTTAKGKLNGLVFVTRSADGSAFLLDAPGELRESLALRLGRYIIADDCELLDVTDTTGLIHAFGETAPEGTDARHNDIRFGQPGFDLWLSDGSDAEARLLADGWRSLSAADAEALRIRQGVPRWGAELDEKTLPAEARLDRSAVDFHKGCYIGQEVISRIRSVGRVNRLLVRLRSESPLFPGMHLFAEDGSDIGIVTSASECAALGFVKSAHASTGTQLTARNPEKELSSRCEIIQTPEA